IFGTREGQHIKRGRFYPMKTPPLQLFIFFPGGSPHLWSPKSFQTKLKRKTPPTGSREFSFYAHPWIYEGPRSILSSPGFFLFLGLFHHLAHLALKTVFLLGLLLVFLDLVVDLV